MKRPRIATILMAGLLSWPAAAIAEVTVTNRAYSPIEVQVDEGDRRALQGGAEGDVQDTGRRIDRVGLSLWGPQGSYEDPRWAEGASRQEQQYVLDRD